MKFRFETKYYYLLKECWHYFRHLCKYNASIKTDKDREKMQYTLLRENHVIEKGLSLRTPRRDFGKEKVACLLKRLSKYNELYGAENKGFLLYPLSTIARYIDYQKQNGTDISDIENAFGKLLADSGIEASQLTMQAGVVEVSKDDIQNQTAYSDTIRSRHSVRYFTREMPSDEVIEQALELAQCTPSACNRQSWKVHVFYASRSVELLKWQGGSRGFEDEPQMALLVTANSKAFLKYEPFQAYVDGGLYAMNLTNALHSLGLGTIPLSCGFGYRKLNQLHKLFGIPKNEVPIMIIGVGCLEDRFRVAVSERKPVASTTVKHIDENSSN